jgi:two-component system sensor histidine kinase KdpD
LLNYKSVLTLLVLVGLAAFTSNLAGRLRTRAQLGVRGAQENAAVAAFAQALARISDRDETARIVCEDVARLLSVNAVLLTQEAFQARTGIGGIDSWHSNYRLDSF